MSSSSSSSLLLDAPGLCYGADVYRPGHSLPLSTPAPTPVPGSAQSSGLGSSINSSCRDATCRDTTDLASAQSVRYEGRGGGGGVGSVAVQWSAVATTLLTHRVVYCIFQVGFPCTLEIMEGPSSIQHPLS